MKDLQNNKIDFVASTLKGVLGAVPFVGSAIGEAITVFLPEQRMDRFAKYLQEIGEKVESAHLTDQLLQERLSEIERVELLQEGAIHASRSVSDDRRSYLSNMVAHGICSEKIDFSEQMHFMRMLSDLTDVEIIILRYYLHDGKDGDQEFRGRHKPIYDLPLISQDSTKEDGERLALQMSYRVHLASLGLLQQTNVIEAHIDTIRTTDQKSAKYEITDLGGLFLKRIEMDTPFEENPNGSRFF